MANSNQDRTVQNQQNNRRDMSTFGNVLSWIFASVIIGIVTVARPIGGAFAYAIGGTFNAGRNLLAFAIASFGAYIYLPFLGFVVGTVSFVVNFVSKSVGLFIGATYVLLNLIIRLIGVGAGLAATTFHLFRPVLKVLLGGVYLLGALTLRVFAATVTGFALVFNRAFYLLAIVLSVLAATWEAISYMVRPVLRGFFGLLALAINFSLKLIALFLSTLAAIANVIAQVCNSLIASAWVLIVLFNAYILRPALSLVLGLAGLIVKGISLILGVANVILTGFLALLRLISPLIITVAILVLSVLSKTLGIMLGAAWALVVSAGHVLFFGLRLANALLSAVLHVLRPIVKTFAGLVYVATTAFAYVTAYSLAVFAGLVTSVVNLARAVVGAALGLVWGIVAGLFGGGIRGLTEGFENVFKWFGGTTDLKTAFMDGFNFVNKPTISLRQAFDNGYSIIDGNSKGFIAHIVDGFNAEALIIHTNPLTGFMDVFNWFPSEFNPIKAYGNAKQTTDSFFGTQSYDPVRAFYDVPGGDVTIAQSFINGWNIVGLREDSAQPLTIIRNAYNQAIVVATGWEGVKSWAKAVWDFMPGTRTSFRDAFNNGRSVVAPNPEGSTLWGQVKAGYNYIGRPIGVRELASNTYYGIVGEQNTVLGAVQTGYNVIPSSNKSFKEVFLDAFNPWAKRTLAQSFIEGYEVMDPPGEGRRTLLESFVHGFSTQCTFEKMKAMFKGINEHWTAGGEIRWRDQTVASDFFHAIAGYVPTVQGASECFDSDVNTIKRYTDLAVTSTGGFAVGCLVAIPVTIGYTLKGIFAGFYKGGIPGLLHGLFVGFTKGITFPFRNLQREYNRIDQGLDVEHHWYDLIENDWDRINTANLFSWETAPERYHQTAGGHDEYVAGSPARIGARLGGNGRQGAARGNDSPDVDAIPHLGRRGSFFQPASPAASDARSTQGHSPRRSN